MREPPATRSTPRPPASPAEAVGVRADEVLSRRDLMLRLRWGRKQWSRAQAAGLKSVLLGRERYIVGRWVIELLERLAGEQCHTTHGTGNGEGPPDA